MNRWPKLSIVAPNVSPEEAASVVAALEQFMRATAPTPHRTDRGPNPWQQSALHESVSREPQPLLPWL